MRLPLFAAALSLCLSAAVPALAQPVADSIWSGGPILTMNDKAMRAQAVAVAGGKIVAVGRRADVMKLKGPNTQMVDLQGRTLLPGFVDAHGHVVVGGLQALSANLLAPPDGQVRDIASLQQTLRDWAQKNAAAVEKTQLIIGFGYDNAQLKELRHPTKEELDAVSQDIPILIIHQSSHLATANSAMLKAMGIDASSKDPAGGVIQRKPGSNEPNGTLEETAFFAGMPVVLGRIGPEGLKVFAREGAKLWARYGYTTAQEGRSIPQTADLMRQVAAEGGFAIDVATYPDE
jgi:predicted amidohydrolase YtcJ